LAKHYLELGNNNAVIIKHIVINTFIFRYAECYVTLLLNRELVSRVCLVSVFSDIVKDCPKIRNLPKIYLRILRMWPQGSISNGFRNNQRQM